jgi:tRNA nucleotidyltransferase (CCA-adding enzyme)
MSESASNLSHRIHEKFPSDLLYFIQRVGALADKEGQRAVIVGGVVRDILAGWPVKDGDIMLEPPLGKIVEAVAKEFNAQVAAHPKFLTFAVKVSDQLKVDFVTAREESYPNPAALPVVKPSTIEKDFQRRDFTVNAMACFINKPKWGQLLDPFFGQRDLEKKWIRILHPLSFQDDPTRIFRAVRFAARFGFTLEETTRDVLKKAVRDKLPALLSPVRRRHEFEMVLKETNPVPALEMLEQLKVLPFVYKGAALTDAHRQSLNSGNGLVDRVALWIKGAGDEKAKGMLDELQFERGVKQDVLRQWEK